MFQGGALKLKGVETKVKKKKRGGSSGARSGEKSAVEIDAVVPIVPSKTRAEIELAELRKSKLNERVEKMAEKSHKERVDEFNSYLASMSEIHDIPRVGPG